MQRVNDLLDKREHELENLIEAEQMRVRQYQQEAAWSNERLEELFTEQSEIRQAKNRIRS